MEPAMRLATLIAIPAMLAPTLAWGNWEYARWGMSPEQVAQASGGTVKVLPPAERKKHPAYNSETAAAGTYSEGALRLGLSFSFDLKNGGLTCVVFTGLDRSQNELLKQSFIRRNGPPQTTGGLPDGSMDTLAWYKQDEIGLTLMRNDPSFATQCKPGTIPPIE
jgi:hypothetical protein